MCKGFWFPLKHLRDAHKLVGTHNPSSLFVSGNITFSNWVRETHLHSCVSKVFPLMSPLYFVFHGLLSLLKGQIPPLNPHCALSCDYTKRTACSVTRNLLGLCYRNGSQFTVSQYIWGLTLAWFCHVQCVEIPVEQISHEYRDRNTEARSKWMSSPPPPAENWEQCSGW